MPPAVGPQLPPELQKRKRDQNDDDNSSNSDSDSDSSTGPQPPTAAQKPQSPPSAKRSRVIGPSLPAAPLDQRPTSSPPSNPVQSGDSERSSGDDSSDDDDGFGPQLPTSSSSGIRPGNQEVLSSTTSTVKATPAKRDEWMTLAPESGDWSQRIDPTKLKSRKFQTGRGAKGPSSSSTAASTGAGVADSWHETAEEKLERLRREAMGIRDSDARGKHADKAAHGNGYGHEQDEATARRLREYNVCLLHFLPSFCLHLLRTLSLTLLWLVILRTKLVAPLCTRPIRTIKPSSTTTPVPGLSTEKRTLPVACS